MFQSYTCTSVVFRLCWKLQNLPSIVAIHHNVDSFQKVREKDVSSNGSIT